MIGGFLKYLMQSPPAKTSGSAVVEYFNGTRWVMFGKTSNNDIAIAQLMTRAQRQYPAMQIRSRADTGLLGAWGP